MMDTERNRQRLVEVRAAIAGVQDSLTAEEFAAAAETQTERGGNQRLVIVPAAFWNDHHSRDCDYDSIELRSSHATEFSDDDDAYVLLVMAHEFLMELVSDASFYTNGFSDEYEPLMESARRTIVALWIQFPELMKADADASTDRDNTRWALGIERDDTTVMTS